MPSTEVRHRTVTRHRQQRLVRIGRLGQLGEAEIEDLDGVGGRDEEILRLDVTVHDAALVRRRKAEGDFDRVAHGGVDGKTLRLHALTECGPLEQLRHEIGCALMEARMVHAQDARVIQRGRSPRFLLEPPYGLWVCRIQRGQHLDRHFPSELGVLCVIDNPHAAGPEFLAERISSDERSRLENHADHAVLGPATGPVAGSRSTKASMSVKGSSMNAFSCTRST